MLGTIRLGKQRLDGVLGALDTEQVNVHGLGFSRDGRALAVVSVTSNALQVIDTTTNSIVQTSYVGRAPHEAFISPDGQTVWVAVRGQNYVAIVSRTSGEVSERIVTAPGASKVVFSPNGQLAYVNHLQANVLFVIDVATHQIVARIPIPSVAGGSADEAITPGGQEVWLGHPGSGKTTVVDAVRFGVKAVLDTGPRTNHPNFVSRDNKDFAYVTVGDLNQTVVVRRAGDTPKLVTVIHHSGQAPHGIWPSPDNTRIYVALQKSDAVDVIETATNQIINTLHVGQDPQALVYVAGAVPSGSGAANLTQQGFGARVETVSVDVRGVAGNAIATIRSVQGLDQVDVEAHGLSANQTFTVFASAGSAADAIMDVNSNGGGNVAQALAFAKFFDNYNRVSLLPKGQRP